MPIRDEFVALLRCPADRQPLENAEPGLVEKLNQAIAAGQLRNQGGDLIAKPIDGALVRADKKLAYAVLDGIPVMLVDEAIPLDATFLGN